MKDVVAEYPDEIADYKKLKGDIPAEVKFEKGFFCIWENKFTRYFIHTRATLPLKDINGGIGFGLWVELTQEDFDKFMKAQEGDKLYADFMAEGTLANNWPGFENVNFLKVVVKGVKPDQKPYIWEVKVDDTVDPVFRMALLTQKDDVKRQEEIRALVQAWMNDFGSKE